MDVRRWYEAAAALVLPLRCQLCRAATDRRTLLCGPCAALLPPNPLACPRCALPPAAPGRPCPCAARAPAWDAAWVPFRYAWPLDQLETRFKFGRDLVAGQALAQQWAVRQPPHGLPDAIVPVPLHRQRLRTRGFNQALELVRPVARRLGIPVAPRALKRVHATSPQTDLDAAGRAANVVGAFAPGTPVPGQRVAIVDDVMTTGATLGECARVLKAAGIPWVEVWALARTLRPG
jgi:ComF family protein